MTDAIIFVPAGRAGRHWLTICGQYCASRGYTVAAVVSGRDAADWDGMIQMVHDESIDVIVIGKRDHQPPDRRPRVEVVAEEPITETAAPRRPRRV